jgi:hypothetical protein
MEISGCNPRHHCYLDRPFRFDEFMYANNNDCLAEYDTQHTPHSRQKPQIAFGIREVGGYGKVKRL